MLKTRDVAKDCYEECEPGSTGFIRPDFDRGETLIGFQGVLETAKVLADEGKIIILDLHHENQTGRKLLDSIKFIRVR